MCLHWALHTWDWEQVLVPVPSISFLCAFKSATLAASTLDDNQLSTSGRCCPGWNNPLLTLKPTHDNADFTTASCNAITLHHCGNWHTAMPPLLLSQLQQYDSMLSWSLVCNNAATPSALCGATSLHLCGWPCAVVLPLLVTYHFYGQRQAAMLPLLLPLGKRRLSITVAEVQ